MTRTLIALFAVAGMIAASAVEAHAVCEQVAFWNVGSEPSGIGAGPAGSGVIYIAKRLEKKVQKYTVDGTFVSEWGTAGSGPGQFDDPEGVDVDASGSVYVADTQNQRIQKFDQNGTYLMSFNVPNKPYDVAVDVDSSIYVATKSLTQSGNVYKYTAGGSLVVSFPGSFSNVPGVAVDGMGSVFVADSGNQRVQKFTTDGTLVSTWGSAGTGNGQFQWPYGLDADLSGSLFVADYVNNRVQKFTNGGAFITAISTFGPTGGAFVGPLDVAVNAESQVFAAGPNAIKRFSCLCGNGALDAGEICDDGNLSDGDCCSSSCQFEGSGTVCRSALGACDLQEVCTGASPVCPSDMKSTAACRPAVDVCDAPETCDGSNNDCPADTFQSSSVVCRASAGACDIAESCTGSSSECPGDVLEPSTIVCRPSTGACDVAENCNGASAACPSDGKVLAGMECRPSAGICDIAESCDGVGNACPSDGFQSSSVVCRGSAGACDIAENCTGSSSECPVDVLEPSTIVCRPSNGACDLAEACTGTSAECPGDTGLPDTDADTVCDAIDNCNSIPNQSQGNADGDLLGDACDPCSNFTPVRVSKPRLSISKLNTAPGDDRLSFRGSLTVPVPLAPSIDASAKGVRVLVEASTGAVVLDAIIPGGVYDKDAKVGWRRNSKGTSFRYSNRGNPVPLVRGINAVSVRLNSRNPGLVRVSVRGKLGSYPVTSGDLPLKATFILDSPYAATNQCGDTVAPPFVCAFNRSGASLQCKATP